MSELSRLRGSEGYEACADERAKDLKTRSPSRRAGAQETIPLAVRISKALRSETLGSGASSFPLCLLREREGRRGEDGPRPPQNNPLPFRNFQFR